MAIPQRFGGREVPLDSRPENLSITYNASDSGTPYVPLVGSGFVHQTVSTKIGNSRILLDVLAYDEASRSFTGQVRGFEGPGGDAIAYIKTGDHIRFSEDKIFSCHVIVQPSN